MKQQKPLPCKCQLQLCPPTPSFFFFFAELSLLVKLHPEVSEADNNSAQKQEHTQKKKNNQPLKSSKSC